MVLKRRDKVVRLLLVITLLLLIFLPAQMPLPSLKMGAIATFSLVALILQAIVFRQTEIKSDRTQGIILMILTVAISAILFII